MAALLMLAASFPLILLAAILVKLTSRGPAFYRQIRVGQNGRLFALYKLRTMVTNAEVLTGPVWATSDDPRVTPVGRLLRRTHIDELPQLINILLGHMSLVGPRPERPELMLQLEWKLPGYRERLHVRPGVTGLAQLRLPPDANVDDVRQKLMYDLYYVQNANSWLDLRIIVATGFRVLREILAVAWKLVDLPQWETIERHVSPLVDSMENCHSQQERDCNQQTTEASSSQPVTENAS